GCVRQVLADIGRGRLRIPSQLAGRIAQLFRRILAVVLGEILSRTGEVLPHVGQQPGRRHGPWGFRCRSWSRRRRNTWLRLRGSLLPPLAARVGRGGEQQEPEERTARGHRGSSFP